MSYIKNKKLLASFITVSILVTVCIFAYKLINIQTEKEKSISKQGVYLDTFIDIKIFGEDNPDILEQAFQLCEFYENILSKTKVGSDIYNLNKNGYKGVQLSDDSLYVIKKGIFYSEISKGSFDISIEPIVKLWDFKSGKKFIPDQSIIEQNLKNVNYKDIEIEGNKVTFKKENMEIDLGAIAKGYIGDKIKEFLESKGVENVVINLGGNIVCIGDKGGRGFNVGIQKPFENRGESIDAINVKNKSVVSSGIYERYFEKDGKIYHHILNSSTGYPIENSLAQVTIVSNKSIDGDALSTVCFSQGIENGIKLIDSLEDVEAVFIDKDGKIYRSKNFNKYEI